MFVFTVGTDCVGFIPISSFLSIHNSSIYGTTSPIGYQTVPWHAAFNFSDNLRKGKYFFWFFLR